MLINGDLNPPILIHATLRVGSTAALDLGHLKLNAD